MDPVRRRMLKIFGVILGIGFAYVIWFHLTGIGSPCVINATTGMLCPGCGVSRMFLSLLKGDIPGAFRYNGCAFALLVYWGLTALLCFAGKPGFARNSRFLYSSLWVSVALLVLFGILRNII